MTIRFAAILAIAALCPSVAAEAQTRSTDANATRVTARIRAADLDLASDHGRAMLDQRIARAVRAACLTRSGNGAPVMTSGGRQCMADMTERAQARAQVMIALARGARTVATR